MWNRLENETLLIKFQNRNNMKMKQNFNFSLERLENEIRKLANKNEPKNLLKNKMESGTFFF